MFTKSSRSFPPKKEMRRPTRTVDIDERLIFEARINVFFAHLIRNIFTKYICLLPSLQLEFEGLHELEISTKHWFWGARTCDRSIAAQERLWGSGLLVCYCRAKYCCNPFFDVLLSNLGLSSLSFSTTSPGEGGKCLGDVRFACAFFVQRPSAIVFDSVRASHGSHDGPRLSVSQLLVREV